MKKQLLDLDTEWARDLVLLAKNTYVWLEQLSHKYGIAVTRLDQIPDKEIAQIAAQGMTGLWLVGIWQRSPASRKIKQLYGREDALASAYSIVSYHPAQELGGREALDVLEEKLAAHDMLLACDMVPNHSGIDAPWLFEHPDRYITTKVNPHGNFQFDTPNLSDNPAVGIYLEKGYYDQTGAAEVFKLVFPKSGEECYVYHGNDGTSMPWNDTAQLNYLNPLTRQAVIEEIVKVAQKFPIIRLDAAMTLTREHFKRLWFPTSPGEQSIPTRESFLMSNEEFDRQMPREFWAEVIGELSRKAPHTLLIAEAFWLTEHFFINEIGMHRVYNSGFMHQLRDEKNREYRSYLKHILRDDPAMLERFVNFLTTPDESPAALQFADPAKYLGACRLQVCLPGLPMFGHGQWEGLKEQYGMDIPRPTQQETVDESLVEQHQRLISPLLHQRACFSSVKNFRLYDFVQPDGTVNEDVLVFSNANEAQAFLIIFNNNPKIAQGTIGNSVLQKLHVENGQTVSLPLWQNLNLPAGAQAALLEFPDYEKRAKERIVDLSSGLQFKLAPYESCVYRVSSA